MTTRADFSAAEWKLLIETPISVGYAVSTVEKSGAGGQTKENVTITRAAWLDPEEEFARNELMRSIVEYRKDFLIDLEQGLNQEDGFSAYQSPSEDFEETFLHALGVAIKQCSAAISLLESKASPTEVEVFKIYVMSVADKVAKAAKEGGLFRKNDNPVSEREQMVIEQIAEALNYSLDSEH